MAVDLNLTSSSERGIRVDDRCYLYKITHILLPIVYIGLSKNPKTRFNEHRNTSSNRALANYFKELGVETFIFTVIASGTREEIEELEALCITEAKTLHRLTVCNILEGSVFTGESSQIGEDHWNARFKESDVIHIRSMYATGTMTQKDIGKIYGVSNKVISNITSGARWREAPGTISNNITTNKVANRRKLSDIQVLTVRQEALEEYEATGKLCIPEIAELYGVSRGSMRMLLNGTSYSSLSGPILSKDYYKDFGHGN